ncbi:MAG TPA: VWA domain-containing protein [Candidatus Obscuribacterales bacterium]
MSGLLGSVLVTLIGWLAVSVLALASHATDPERPVNFIFLIDVSGSMVSKATMVPDSDGRTVTLFEALRDALEQIVEDERLIGRNSKISFITFGTRVAEKSGWPSRLATGDDRRLLLAKIQSPSELQADRHGDTYMAGALDLAYAKAQQFSAGSDPCTTTFIIMLTDGWDEPPPGARLKVHPAASRFVARQQQSRSKLGVSTWQCRVIGLQRLPDRKIGTTTARQLAELLGGEFIDVSKQEGSSVSERIFSALRQTIESLRGQIKLAGKTPVDFGQIDENGMASATVPVTLNSCYAEKITNVSGTWNSLSLTLGQPEYVLDPLSDRAAGPTGARYDIQVKASVDSDCMPGTHEGTFDLVSTADAPRNVPFRITVPARIAFEPEAITTVVRKRGFLFPENTAAVAGTTARLHSYRKVQADYVVQLQPSMLTLAATDRTTAELATLSLGTNEASTVRLNLKQPAAPVSVALAVPALQAPGLYKGQLKFSVTGSTRVVAPESIPVQVVVKPSAWEEVSPLALPILLLLVGSLILAVLLWLARMKKQGG